IKLPLFVLLLLGLLLGLPVLKAQETLNCGKYPKISTQKGPACQRIAILPWYAASPGAWETDFELIDSSRSLEMGYGASLASAPYDGIGHNLELADSERSNFIAESVYSIRGYLVFTARTLAGVSCRLGSCVQDPIATGSLIVTFDGADDSALD